MSEHVCSYCGSIATQEVSHAELGKRWFCDEHGRIAVETMAGSEVMWQREPNCTDPEPEPERVTPGPPRDRIR